MKYKYLQIQLLQGLDHQKIAIIKQSIWRNSEQKDTSVHELCGKAKHSNYSEEKNQGSWDGHYKPLQNKLT